MTFRYIMRHMSRGILKSVLVIGLCAILILTLGTYLTVKSDKAIRLKELYQNVTIYVNVAPTDGGSIPIEINELMQENGLLESYYGEIDIADKLKYIFAPADLLENTENPASLIAVNNIGKYSLVEQKYMTIKYADGFDDTIFKSAEPFCVISQELCDKYNLSFGSKITVAVQWQSLDSDKKECTIFTKGAPFTVCGIYNTLGQFAVKNELESAMLIPLNALTQCNELFFDNTTSFYEKRVSDMDYIYNQIKTSWLRCHHISLRLIDNYRHSDLLEYMETADAMRQKYKVDISVDDAEYLRSVKPLEQNVGLLEKLFPVAVAVACLLGGGIPGLIIIQSAKEAAVMRILGTTKRRTRLTLVLEQLSLCLLGLLLGAATLLMLHGAALAPVLPKLALCAGLYFGSCILATTLCATIVTRGKALDLLQTKE